MIWKLEYLFNFIDIHILNCHENSQKNQKMDLSGVHKSYEVSFQNIL